MSIGVLFWLLWILAIIFGAWASWPVSNLRPLGGSLLVWVLFGLLGWKVFGFPIHG